MTKQEQKQKAKEFYTIMYRTRRFEEEVFEFYKRGLMPGLAHLYLGEEAVAAGVCGALEERDFIGSTHRGHGHLVSRGADLNKMMAEILGKATGYSKGKGGSMHMHPNTWEQMKLPYVSSVIPLPMKEHSMRASTWQQPGISQSCMW